MLWVRKAVVLLLSLILLVSLIAGAAAASANINLTRPAKLETWLNQSNFYNSIVANAISEAEQSASGDLGAGRVSLSDTAVQQAIKVVFSHQLLQRYTNTFLASNYAWLEGKTARPDFKINLMPAKQQLARQVEQAVQTRLNSLPACTADQLAQMQATLNTDPLSITCLPPTLSPQTAAQQASDQIAGSSDFLGNPVVTADALNPNGGNRGEPYYQKASAAPKLYRWSRRLPWICGLAAILSILGIVLLAPKRRRGWRRTGIVFALAGVILIVATGLTDSLLNRLEKNILNSSNIDQLQQSLTNFLHRVATQLDRVDLWFGIGFLVVAVVIFACLWFTRRRQSGSKRPPLAGDIAPAPNAADGRPFSPNRVDEFDAPRPVAKPPTAPPIRRTGSNGDGPVFRQPRPAHPGGPRRPKPPRLIQ